MDLAKYKHAASFIHLASALVHSMNEFITDIEFVQLYLLFALLIM